MHFRQSLIPGPESSVENFQTASSVPIGEPFEDELAAAGTGVFDEIGGGLGHDQCDFPLFVSRQIPIGPPARRSVASLRPPW